MADQKASDQSFIENPDGIVIPVIKADEQAESGYSDWLITITNFLKNITSAISTNSDNISTNSDNLTSLEEINKRKEFTNVTGAQQWAQPSKSNINEIHIDGAATGGTVKIGTTVGGDNILAEQSIASGQMDIYSPDGSAINNGDTSRTIYLTFTGTISTNIYYRQNSNF